MFVCLLNGVRKISKSKEKCVNQTDLSFKKNNALGRIVYASFIFSLFSVCCSGGDGGGGGGGVAGGGVGGCGGGDGGERARGGDVFY